ncbi:MAG: lipopolysaccharide biosynthesis protein [Bacteroidales bacterium]|nr:lipopolysaccharide biosynthesis protein [Bacteroidales bacterium]
MAQSIKKLFSDSVVYGLSSIVGRFLNYLLVPLYTYKIAASTGGYGVVTNIYAYTALILVLLTFGMETTFFYFANREGGNPRRTFATALGAVGAVAALFVVVVMAFSAPITQAMGYAEHPDYVMTMAAVVAIDAFQAILFAWLRFEGRAWKFATLKLAFIVANIALNLFVFLVAPGIADHPWMSWYNPDNQVGYIFTVNLICTAAVTLGFVPELRIAARAGFDRHLLPSMLRYTWPLLLLGVVGVMNQVADKIIFRYLMPGTEGEVQLGIYGACVKIAMIMAMITQAFRYAYEPFVFGGGRDKESKPTQAAVMKYFVIFTLLAYLAVVCYMDVLRHIINPSYWEGLRTVPIVMMAEIFMGIYFNLSFWYKLTGETWWGAIMSAIGCVVLIAVNVVFVPKVGYMACAWGGFCGYGVCMLLSYFIGQRKNPVPYDVRRILFYFLLAICLAWIHGLIPDSSVVLRVAIGTLLLLVYAAVVVLRERELVAPIIKRLKR